jgi:signal transduction histidine kinase/AraC-like DNA-binding protein
MMSDIIRIGLLADSADPYWVEVRETIWQLASQRREYSAGADDRAPGANVELVEIEFIVDVHDYAAKVEEILTLELGALIAVPFAMPLLYQLLDSGLPVISLHERPIDHPKFSRPRSLYQSARLACEYLARQLEGSGPVLILGGRTGATRTSYSSRLQAAYDVFAQFPGISVIHLPAPWDRTGALAAAQAALDEIAPLAAHSGRLPHLHDAESALAWLAPFSDLPVVTAGPFRGIFGLSDTLALVGQEVCRQRHLLAQDAVVVGINGDPLAIAAIARGEMAATVATSAAHLATEALRLACLAATGAPLPTEFDYCPQLVTVANVAEIALAKLVAIADVPSRLVGVNRRQEERRLIQLQTSLEINRRIGAILDGETLMREISELIRTNYGYDYVQVFLWDDTNQTLVRRLPKLGSGLPERWSLAESGLLGRALLSRRPVYAPDLLRMPAAVIGDTPATRTRVVAPIRLGDTILGVLDVHSNVVRRHAQADLDALQSLADELGIAMRNAQLYAEALSARTEAERASHLKTRLLANVSHELRTPLNVILGYSQAALSETNPQRAAMSEDLTNDMQQIQRSGQHLVRLIDDLLNLSLAEIGALEIVPEALDPAPLLANVFHNMAGCRQRHAVAWRLELPAHLPALHADPLRLRQVLLNLLHNAEKHTFAGHITLRAAEQDNWLHIWIEDTGRGIAPAQQQLLNASLSPWDDDADADLDGRQFGAGLGLRVAQHIVHLHTGRLHLESRPGHGTLCHIELPLAPLAASPGQSTAPVAEVQGPDAQERMLEEMLRHTSELPRRIADYIVAHYATNLTREEIAAALQVSNDYVSRIFRKETGMTPWQFLNQYRVLQAQKLLLTTQYNVTEIGALVGFSDPAYFVRIFHRETGKSPQHYRKSAK